MSPMLSYEDAEKILTSSSKFHIELGLGRISKILELLGNPQDKLKVIHVAGTNGKGSTCAIIAQILKEAGFKTGFFSSPHLVKYTERFRINGFEIEGEEFAKRVFKICDLADKNNIALTEFEILTALGFEWFYDCGVDYLVLEVGLGGRLDATNVVKKPVVSVITAIDFDHTERLGKTINEIAFEKGGIIKEGVPLVLGFQNKGFQVLKELAKEKRAPIIPAKPVETVFENNVNYAVVEGEKLVFNLLGNWQGENLALALSVMKHLNVNKGIIKNGLRNVNWYGRFQYFPNRNLIVDGAHNPNGTKALRESLDKYFPNQNFCFIYGALKNKDYSNSLKNLVREGDELYFCTFNNYNSETYENLAHSINFSSKKISISDINNLKSPLLTVICGSLYMIGNILRNKM